MTWSARQYAAFEHERTRPVRDLLGALPDIRARAAVDLGCGPGNSTEALVARFPEAVVRGIDSSPDMIDAARRRFSGRGVAEPEFEVRGIEDWSDTGPFDVILANAVLQWVPDHAVVVPDLVRRLAPGGGLAVQMPDNLDTPAHRLMRETAAQGPWAGKLAEVSKARTPIAAAGWYYELLRPLCGAVDVWRTTYHHPLAGGAGAIVEWFKGTGLRPFLDPLDEVERAAYLRQYTAEVADEYQTLPDGSVLLPFPRLFVIGIR